MKSMTGFGSAEVHNESHWISVEIKSYNNRYLDIVLNSGPVLSPLEERIRDCIRRYCQRGRIEVSVRARDLRESLEISLDRENVDAYVAVLEELRERASIMDPVTIANLLSLDGLVRIERSRDIESIWRAIVPVLEDACGQLDASRLREGGQIRSDLERQLTTLETQLETIRQAAPTIAELVRTQLRARFVEVLGDLVDEQRILAELAVQLARTTINEELVRLQAHLDASRKLVRGDEPQGKKLDFLFQEMNREINTIGSKSVLLEIGEAVIEMKDALENLREQCRNVE